MHLAALQVDMCRMPLPAQHHFHAALGQGGIGKRAIHAGPMQLQTTVAAPCHYRAVGLAIGLQVKHAAHRCVRLPGIGRGPGVLPRAW